MKLLKWFGITLLVAVIALVLYLTLIFNPNDFKPEIIAQVNKLTGRELVIKDDLNWTFYPTLGIKLGGVSFSNPDGFTPVQMLTVKSVVAEVALMPLLTKDVKIDALKLDGLTLNLVTNKQGKTSFDGLSATGKSKNATTNSSSEGIATNQAAATQSNVVLAELSIGGVDISNTRVNIINQQTGTEQHFILDSFTLGQFSLGQSATLAYEAHIVMPDLQVNTQGDGQILLAANLGSIELSNLTVKTQVMGKSIPNGNISTVLKSDIAVDLHHKLANVNLVALNIGDINIKGKVAAEYGHVTPSINLALNIGDINLNDWLPPKSDAASAEKHEQSKSTPPRTTKATEPDLTGMSAVNLNADIKVKSINLDKLHTENWLLQLSLHQGILQLKKLSSQMYDGQLDLSATLNGQHDVARYEFKQSLTGVQIQPLLHDVAGVNFLSGNANFSVSGSGHSLIPENLQRNLLAQGQFAIKDGSLYGVNIPQMIRSAEAKLKGDFKQGDQEALKTDFTSLTGSFSLKQGIVNNPDLDMQSPLIRLSGHGDADIINRSIDYSLITKVVASLKGQGGEHRHKGLKIPFRITGTFTQPKFALDTDALLKHKVQDEVKKVEDKLKQRLLDKLGLGGF
ncbi:cell envelope biogenesis protein AsmA [Shewanella sp. NFH-SH190041]|uniref:AsmA family protein n=1 Tax=Shewanella sp. NFH-SH190041 TaxID=2950245 RepID=UPI0021C300E4|nr:AsmA family protein [Shewanella sp. NFH-SH190041]BDM64066.1 cell envelope biogenesis protein AsmA [Shewanella sp. NFH-SH190041]